MNNNFKNYSSTPYSVLCLCTYYYYFYHPMMMYIHTSSTQRRNNINICELNSTSSETISYFNWSIFMSSLAEISCWNGRRTPCPLLPAACGFCRQNIWWSGINVLRSCPTTATDSLTALVDFYSKNCKLLDMSNGWNCELEPHLNMLQSANTLCTFSTHCGSQLLLSSNFKLYHGLHYSTKLK